MGRAGRVAGTIAGLVIAVTVATVVGVRRTGLQPIRVARGGSEAPRPRDASGIDSAGLWPREVPVPHARLEAALIERLRPPSAEALAPIPAKARARIAAEPAYGVLLSRRPEGRLDFVHVDAQDVIRVSPDGVTTRGIALAEACSRSCERVTWISDAPGERGRMLSIHFGSLTGGIPRVSTVLQCQLLASAELIDCLLMSIH